MLVCLSIYTGNITGAECTVTSIIKLCEEENQKARIKDVLYSKFFHHRVIQVILGTVRINT